MKNIFMTRYEVQGIKVIDQQLSLSFYKKTVTKPIETRNYNIKGLYGMNGAGKSAVVTSVDILRKLLVNADYLNNPVVQKSLEALINRKTKQLSIEVEYMIDMRTPMLFRYKVELRKNYSGKYIIGSEELSTKKALSRNGDYRRLFSVKDGEMIYIEGWNQDDFTLVLKEKTTNLLVTSSVASLLIDKIFLPGLNEKKEKVGFLAASLIGLFIFGRTIFVYKEQSDDHTDYVVSRLLPIDKDSLGDDSNTNDFLKSMFVINQSFLNEFSIDSNIISKEGYARFTKEIEKLQQFIRIFKPDLKKIDIDKKEKGDVYVCSLIMVYDSYSVNSEFESTGIKKLIKLYAYLNAMVKGGIVFIDEFDSNLHDVYLCALLEYLMEYGEGQLCFTTHNVGPMDILKRNKKSIDFISLDHRAYPWVANGNYSPSSLYRSGMIEGSPFNVDSIDFIGVFDTPEEAE